MNITTGKPSITMDFSGNMTVSFPVLKESKAAVKTFSDKLGDMKDKLSVEIKEYRRKRSLNANSYFWKLCGELADVLSTTGEKYSAVDIYRKYILDLGIMRQVEISENAVETLVHSWGLHGIGWLAEKADYAKIEGFVTVNLYYGSSTFNTKQMSKLIDMVVQDCKEQNIETLTPNELALLKDGWGA